MIKIRDRLDVSVRYEVLVSGSVYSYIYAAGAPSITMQSDSELKTSISGTFHAYHDIDFGSQRLRVIVNLNGDEYPMGTYCITSERKSHSGGADYINVEGYSLLYLTQQSRIESRLFFAKNTLYTAAIEELLIGSGITDYDITPSPLRLATDREDWEIGASRLEIINQLLTEISYNTAYPDNAGKIICEPASEISADNIDHVYTADAYSIIGPDYTAEGDLHGKRNVFMAICSHPEFDGPLVAVSENNAEGCPYNIDSIGRRLHTVKVSNTASQESLQMYADNLRMRSLMSAEEVSYETAINPEHSVFDVVALNNGNLQGVYAETSWSMTLSGAAMMTHRAQRALSQPVSHVGLIDAESTDVYDSGGNRIQVKNYLFGEASYSSDYTAAEMDDFIEKMLGD